MRINRGVVRHWNAERMLPFNVPDVDERTMDCSTDCSLLRKVITYVQQIWTDKTWDCQVDEEANTWPFADETT